MPEEFGGSASEVLTDNMRKTHSLAFNSMPFAQRAVFQKASYFYCWMCTEHVRKIVSRKKATGFEMSRFSCHCEALFLIPCFSLVLT